MLHLEVNPVKNNPTAAGKGSIRHLHRQGGTISGARCHLAPSKPGLSPPCPGTLPLWLHGTLRQSPALICRLAASSSLSPATTKPAQNILMENNAPRTESERGRCCSCWNPSLPPRRVPGGDKGGPSEIPNPADVLQTPFAATVFPALFALRSSTVSKQLRALRFYPTVCDNGRKCQEWLGWVFFWLLPYRQAFSMR